MNTAHRTTGTDVAHIAALILACFYGEGSTVAECHVEHRVYYSTIYSMDMGVVDETINELLDAGYLSSTIVQGDGEFFPALVMTAEGARHVAA
jgi:hypothetical protein